MFYSHPQLQLYFVYFLSIHLFILFIVAGYCWVKFSKAMFSVCFCLSICLCVYIYACLSVHHVCLSLLRSSLLPVSLDLSICIHVSLPVNLSSCLPLYLSAWIPVCLSGLLSRFLWMTRVLCLAKVSVCVCVCVCGRVWPCVAMCGRVAACKLIFVHFYVLCVFSLCIFGVTGILKTGCSFEDDLKLGAEG